MKDFRRSMMPVSEDRNPEPAEQAGRFLKQDMPKHKQESRFWKNERITKALKIAGALHIETNQVNVKATTEEGLGFTGSGEGISSQAICAIEKLTNFSSVDVAAPAGGCAGCGGCAARQM